MLNLCFHTFLIELSHLSRYFSGRHSDQARAVHVQPLRDAGASNAAPVDDVAAADKTWRRESAATAAAAVHASAASAASSASRGGVVFLVHRPELVGGGGDRGVARGDIALSPRTRHPGGHQVRSQGVGEEQAAQYSQRGHHVQVRRMALTLYRQMNFEP